MATATPALTLSPTADVIQLPPPLDGVFPSLADFFAADFDEADELLAGLHRGEVALLVSDEAQGKTHLLLQLALALAGGQSVLPVSSKDKTPRRLLYVNGGDAAALRLQSELQEMLPDMVDTNTAQDNFQILVDTHLHRQPLNLYRHSHWQWFAARVKKQPADLIIIDGMREPLTLTGRSSAAARLDLLRNARQLAADADCAVLVAFTASSRRRLLGTAQAQTVDTVYSLLSDRRRDEQYRQWRCLQSRWTLPADLDLQGDKAGRGYRLCQAEPKVSGRMPSHAIEFDEGRGRESVRAATITPAGAQIAPSYSLRYWLQEAAQKWDAGLPLRPASPLQQGAESLTVPARQVRVAAEAVADETTDAASNAPQKKSGKQANKRHNKKMRRYR